MARRKARGYVGKRRAGPARQARSGGGGAAPGKPDYSDRVGDYAQRNFKFLTSKLWGRGGARLRDQFIAADQRGLKALLRKFKIPFDPGMTIVVVDIETARTNGFDANRPKRGKFYALVLPPAPRRNPKEPHYQEMQAWSSAQYHAINDSYGM